jgi:hypothetical protein
MEKMELIKMEFLMDPGNAASKHSCLFYFFKDGFPEE